MNKKLVAPFAMVVCPHCHGTTWWLETKEFVRLHDNYKSSCPNCKTTFYKQDLLK